VRTLDAGVRFTAVPCPRLVPLIEAAEQTVDAVREYAAPLQAAGCDTVVLGCTHYPLIRPVLQRVFGREVTLVFSADETAAEVADTLARKGWARPRDDGRLGECRFLTTGDPALFRTLGERFLQLPLEHVEQVSVAELERAAA
jgi:glutamate racemase